jgi:hypothetical protein
VGQYAIPLGVNIDDPLRPDALLEPGLAETRCEFPLRETLGGPPMWKPSADPPWMTTFAVPALEISNCGTLLGGRTWGPPLLNRLVAAPLETTLLEPHLWDPHSGTPQVVPPLGKPLSVDTNWLTSPWGNGLGNSNWGTPT